MNQKKIFLVGFMGSGKSTLAKLLANDLHLPCFDTDEMIEKKVGSSISEIFKTKGENHFRDLEGEVLEELIRLEKPSIIATGGGLPCFEERMNLLNGSGITVYLRCSPEKLYERVSVDIGMRPLIEKGTKEETIEFIRQKIKSREAIYEMAHHKIDAGRNIDEVRKEMFELIRQQAVE